MRKQIVVSILCAVLQLNATDLVNGSLTGPIFSFAQPITTQVYDPAGGVWYFGSATSAGDFTLSKAKRTVNITPSFSPIGANLTFTDDFIEFLAVATSRGTTAPILIVIPRTTGLFSETVVTAVNNTGTLEQISPELNDAVNLTTSGIVNIAARENFVFVAVRPSIGNFGDFDGGLALVSLDTTTLVLTPLDANTGNIGNRAVELALDSPVLKGDGGGADVIFQGGSSLNRVALYWDDQLERLYTGVRITTGAGATDIGKSVVVSRLDSNNALVLEAIAPDSALDPAADNIVVAEGASISLTVKDVQVLHASTGPSYLIVNGGRDSADLVGNRIRALPLVDNPDNAAEHGTLADKNSALVNCVFVTPATAIGDLPLETDPAAIVGSGNLPLDPDQDISQMVIVGDAVYVSIATPQSSSEETGLFYSQALFNEEGKIIHWTPWTKRVFPFDGFPNEQEGIKFFTVDAVTSKVWALNGQALDPADSNKIVRVTAWEQETSGDSLVGSLNQTNVKFGACSVLDLDQSTRGFACNTAERYALFGAPETVVFTRISQAFDINNIFSPQQVIENFAIDDNLLETKLGSNSGAVTVMEYSRRAPADNTNYFFAGTPQGLFVFTRPDGSGFNASDLSTLTLPPFSDGRWQKIDSIEGAITDIKTTGNSLYVLAYTTTPTNPMQSRLYRIPFASTVDAMFDPAAIVLIAESALGSLSNTLIFSGIQIIATADDGSTEQLVLTTNNGLYQSSRVGGVQAATSQADALWIQIATGDKFFFNGIAGVDNASLQIITCTGPTGPTGPVAPPSTVWPFNLTDPTNCKTFDRSDINQVSGSSDTLPFELKPEDFNSIETTNSSFNSLYPVTFFWTDGGRRIFIVTRPQDKCTINRLLSLPFDTIEWNINSPDDPIIRDALFETFESFNWVSLIGVSGQLLAGTNKGIIALK